MAPPAAPMAASRFVCFTVVTRGWAATVPTDDPLDELPELLDRCELPELLRRLELERDA
jgi:hypothetical protein